MTNKIKLSGLWKSIDKNGQVYYSGNLNPSARLMIFKNDRKRAERDPDLIAYLVPCERPEGQVGQDRRPESRS